eukprot:8933956-Alexandrium_andersonii.AAC.1
MEWTFAKAMSLGSGANVVISGDWNSEPDDTCAALWAHQEGCGLLATQNPTRWKGSRVIDWAVYRAFA